MLNHASSYRVTLRAPESKSTLFKTIDIPRNLSIRRRDSLDYLRRLFKKKQSLRNKLVRKSTIKVVVHTLNSRTTLIDAFDFNTDCISIRFVNDADLNIDVKGQFHISERSLCNWYLFCSESLKNKHTKSQRTINEYVNIKFYHNYSKFEIGLIYVSLYANSRRLDNHGVLTFDFVRPVISMASAYVRCVIRNGTSLRECGIAHESRFWTLPRGKEAIFTFF